MVFVYLSVALTTGKYTTYTGGNGILLESKNQQKWRTTIPSRIKCYEEATQLEALLLSESSGRSYRPLGHKAGGDGTGLTLDGVEILHSGLVEGTRVHTLFHLKGKEEKMAA